MLYAYFDESGTHGNARVTAIAGYVGTRDQWSSVDNQWQGVLAPYREKGLSYWRTSDWKSQTGQFARIDRPTGNDICQSLTRVLKESDLQVIWAGVDSQTYRSITTPEYRDRVPHPYDFCFFWIVRQLVIWRVQQKLSSTISMVFGIQNQFNGRSETALRSWNSAGLLTELSSIEFAYPKDSVGVQAADLIVGELYQFWLKYPTVEIPLSARLQDLTKSGLREGGFATELTIRKAMTRPDWVNPSLLGLMP